MAARHRPDVFTCRKEPCGASTSTRPARDRENICIDGQTRTVARYSTARLPILRPSHLISESPRVFETVTQRSREMGIRMALGAKPAEVRNLLLGHSIKLVGAGVVIGIPVAVGVARIYASHLFGTSALNPLIFAFVILIVTGVAMLASYFPARRATMVYPMTVLRAE